MTTAALPAIRSLPRGRSISRRSPIRELFTDPVLRAMALLVALTHLLDFATTINLLDSGRHEANPVTALIIGSAGIGGLFAEKVIVAVLTVALMAGLGRRAAIVGAFIAVAITAAAIVNNVAGGVPTPVA